MTSPLKQLSDVAASVARNLAELTMAMARAEATPSLDQHLAAIRRQAERLHLAVKAATQLTEVETLEAEIAQRHGQHLVAPPAMLRAAEQLADAGVADDP